MFENVLGHKSILEKLKSVVESDTPSHAYVFYGKEGIGKRTVACEFVRRLLDVTNLQGCMDYKFVSRMMDKQNILVEQIRDEVIADVYTAPAASKYKVYIIDEADKMNDASQNALLKTLEEPPKSVIIILVTSNVDGLLGTILSRTTNIYFEPLSENEIKEYVHMSGISVGPEQIEFAQGSISTLLKLSEASNKDMFQKVADIIEFVKSKDKVEVLNLLKDINIKEELVIEYLEFLLLKNEMYIAVPMLESVKKAINSNANEDMQKTKLAIELCRM